ncbi:MAG: thioredoxin domain-containing protein [Myxococcota bacterium]|nr:thioredoxin domain-containing protein [Myxococcota bacterium]
MKLKTSSLLPFAAILILVSASACSSTGSDGASSPTAPATAASGGGGEDALGSVSGNVAVVNGESITASELDKEVRAQLIGLRVQAHDIRSKALDKMIDDRLVAAEATKRGTTPEQLITFEVANKIGEVTDEEAKDYFDKNVPPGKAEYDRVKPRIKQILSRQKEQEVRTAFFGGLRDNAGVEILLAPLRFDVGFTDAHPSKGDPKTAPVVIIEFSEFQCPYCSRVIPTMEQVMETYGDKVAVVFRDYPLPMHRDAPKAAEAGHCAHEQGKFWELHDLMFQNQRALSVEQLKGYARTVGLDGAAFDTCLDSGKHSAAVTASTEAGAAAGVRGTPAFFVNGQFINGAQPFENFKKIIDAELKSKGLL